MADIFHEVDEEVRREQLKKLWQRYQGLIVAAVVLVVVGVGAWRGYEYWVAKQAAEASAQFEAAVNLSEQGKHEEAQAAFDKIAAQAPAGYRTLAKLRAAAEIAQRDPKAAVAAYDTLISDSSLDQTLRDLAAVRSAMLLVDTAPLSELKKRLDPMVGKDSAFRHTARELLALSAWRNNDATEARRYIDMIAADGETPASTRQRVDVLSALMAAGDKG
ncbi:MAG: tetratricopeptide repeat protein [Pseudolabrys sp.]|nr:tetratricopeptide repeat protein [Pseudolabrys sp.]MBV9260904.1 tetratricopeptide repeat protein [Pseudolabrys sp.]